MDADLAILTTNGLKITRLRRALVAVFRRTKRAMSAQTAFEKIRSRMPGIGLQSVYRNLDDFENAGLIEPLLKRKRESIYAFCSDRDRHHHHAVCRSCGHVLSIAVCQQSGVSRGLRSLAKDLKRRKGFWVDQHAIELEGICRDCQ